MTRTRLILTVTTAALAAVPATASAEYFFTKTGAEKITRFDVRDRYDGYANRRISVSCRPQGRRAADPRFKYHRWVCSWAAFPDYEGDQGQTDIVCYGTIQITGDDQVGAYFSRVLRGERCEDA
jgi:hypothetical protein